MKYKKSIITIALTATSLSFVFAAKLTVDSSEKSNSGTHPIVVTISLDTESDTVSGIAGNFSFPSDLFTVDSFITESSVVSLWVKQPSLAEEKYIDGRTHVTFEGIFPGGFAGVRSPYYQGVKPGKVFSVILLPKNKGQGTFLVDDIVLNAFNAEATPLKTESVTVPISVIGGPSSLASPYKEIQQINPGSLVTLITRDPLINRNAWYLIVNDKEERSAIEAINVTESYDSNILNITDDQWRKVSSPYVLTYQDRTRYTHVKVVYSNKTYALVTLQPVENSKSISYTSRILVSVVVALSLAYLYGKKLFFFFKKKISNTR